MFLEVSLPSESSPALVAYHLSLQKFCSCSSFTIGHLGFSFLLPPAFAHCQITTAPDSFCAILTLTDLLTHWLIPLRSTLVACFVTYPPKTSPTFVTYNILFALSLLSSCACWCSLRPQLHAFLHLPLSCALLYHTPLLIPTAKSDCGHKSV